MLSLWIDRMLNAVVVTIVGIFELVIIAAFTVAVILAAMELVVPSIIRW